MILSAVQPRDFNQVYFSATEQFDAERYIIAKIGNENLSAFELWAFDSKVPVKYNENESVKLRNLWNKAHRGVPLIGSFKTSIMRMVDYWQETFRVDESD